MSSKDERRVMIECRHLDGRTDTVVLGTVCDVREVETRGRRSGRAASKGRFCIEMTGVAGFIVPSESVPRRLRAEYDEVCLSPEYSISYELLVARLLLCPGPVSLIFSPWSAGGLWFPCGRTKALG